MLYNRLKNEYNEMIRKNKAEKIKSQKAEAPNNNKEIWKTVSRERETVKSR